MTTEEIVRLVDQCNFPGYELRVAENERGEVCLCASYLEADVHTHRVEWQHTRRWLISEWMNRSEIVRTVFACLMASAEHRLREGFTYQDRAIFMPHFDVDRLWALVEEANDRK